MNEENAVAVENEEFDLLEPAFQSTPYGPLDLVAYLHRGANQWCYHVHNMRYGFDLLQAAERDD